MFSPKTLIKPVSLLNYKIKSKLNLKKVQNEIARTSCYILTPNKANKTYCITVKLDNLTLQKTIKNRNRASVTACNMVKTHLNAVALQMPESFYIRYLEDLLTTCLLNAPTEHN